MFDLKAPDRLALLAVEVESDCDDCLVLTWVTKGSGFGMTIIWEHEAGVLTVSDECMGKSFVTSVVDEIFESYPDVLESIVQYVNAARDNPSCLRRYVRMLRFLGRAGTPDDLDKASSLYFFDRSYDPADVRKASDRIRSANGWR